MPLYSFNFHLYKAMKQKILQYLQTIPDGKVTTYKNIADIFWVHPRAVAMVMKYNKHPETYPCYKVIAHSGKISWYNTDRGVVEKVEKLQKEWIKILDGKVDKNTLYKKTFKMMYFDYYKDTLYFLFIRLWKCFMKSFII